MNLPEEASSVFAEAVEADDARAIRDAFLAFRLNSHDLGGWLSVASRLGNMNAMQALLECGADVHWKNADGETAFSFACAYDQFEAACLLHQHGANINSVDSSGGTPLDWAVCHARPSFREWLAGIGGTRNMDHGEWSWPPRADRNRT